MIEQILMGASAVITLSACYCGFYYATQAQHAAELLAEARSQRDGWKIYAHDLGSALERAQAKKPLRTSDGKFASKRAAKTAELREYVASKAAL